MLCHFSLVQQTNNQLPADSNYPKMSQMNITNIEHISKTELIEIFDQKLDDVQYKWDDLQNKWVDLQNKCVDLQNKFERSIRIAIRYKDERDSLDLQCKAQCKVIKEQKKWIKSLVNELEDREKECADLKYHCDRLTQQVHNQSLFTMTPNDDDNAKIQQYQQIIPDAVYQDFKRAAADNAYDPAQLGYIQDVEVPRLISNATTILFTSTPSFQDYIQELKSSSNPLPSCADCSKNSGGLKGGTLKGRRAKGGRTKERRCMEFECCNGIVNNLYKLKRLRNAACHYDRGYHEIGPREVALFISKLLTGINNMQLYHGGDLD